MFPKKAVASVTGIGGMAGALGGIMIARTAGLLFDHYKAAGDITTGYGIMFIICAIAYLVAWIVMKILVPVHRPITNL
jgi:ACS family hexuronate transporter-like MFS transporter